MVHIVEMNFYVVPEKEIKGALRHRYRAEDVDVALYYLLAGNYLYEYPQPHRTGRGRPAGKEFINPFYDPYGRVL